MFSKKASTASGAEKSKNGKGGDGQDDDRKTGTDIVRVYEERPQTHEKKMNKADTKRERKNVRVFQTVQGSSRKKKSEVGDDTSALDTKGSNTLNDDDRPSWYGDSF